MPVTLVVGIAGAVAAVVLGSLSRSRRVDADPIDPEAAQHWLIDHLPDRPGVRDFFRRADRRVAGGVGAVLGLGIVFAAAATVGWIFDTIDRGRGFARWDRAVADWGVEHATETSTDVLLAITHGGDTGWLWLLLASAAGLDWLAKRNPAVFGFAAAVGLGVAGLNNGLKWIIDRDRPDVDHLAGSSGSSFPSGHSATAAACWAAIALIAGRHLHRRLHPALAAAAAAIAIAVAASRALLGVHWLTDVIAGSVVGWSWFFLIALVFGGRLQRLGRPVELAAVQ